jgi:hypothetical protein
MKTPEAFDTVVVASEMVPCHGGMLSGTKSKSPPEDIGTELAPLQDPHLKNIPRKRQFYGENPPFYGHICTREYVKREAFLARSSHMYKCAASMLAVGGCYTRITAALPFFRLTYEIFTHI